MKRYRIFILILLLGTAAIAGSVGSARNGTRSDSPLGRINTPGSRPKPPTSPMDDLDYHVQERMQTSEGFGMSRMLGLEHIRQIPSHSDSASDEEQAVIAELERQGWTVGLSLGSRGLLEMPISKTEWDARRKTGPHVKREPIEEPVLISGHAKPEGMPGPFDLWEIGQKALLASTTSDRYESSIGRWKVDARLVRATRESCLKCHSTEEAGYNGFPEPNANTKLKPGDALGVVIYVYARNPK